ncbi:hypothetical protein OXX69_013022, partial [Metschnikowia pulcherrima]
GVACGSCNCRLRGRARPRVAGDRQARRDHRRIQRRIARLLAEDRLAQRVGGRCRGAALPLPLCAACAGQVQPVRAPGVPRQHPQLEPLHLVRARRARRAQLHGRERACQSACVRRRCTARGILLCEFHPPHGDV